MGTVIVIGFWVSMRGSFGTRISKRL